MGISIFGARTFAAVGSVLAVVAVALVGAPSASADGGVTSSNYAYSTFVNQTLVVNAPGVLANDSTTSTGALRVGLQTPPSRGRLVLNADGSFRYTPELNWAGSETFQYYVIDGLGGRAVGTVTIDVTAASATALADAYSVGTGLYLNVAAPGVLANDSDPSGGQLSVVAVTQPANGTVIMYTNGAFTYISNAGFVGTDSFTYDMSNGTSTVTGPVDITVTANGGGAPVAADPPAGAAASAGSSASLPAASGAGAGAGSASGTGGTAPGTGQGGSAKPADVAITFTKKRTAPRTWVVTAKITNVGAGPATSGTSIATVLTKGVTWSKVKAPKGWTCTKTKTMSTCSLSGSLAPAASASVAYTVKTTPGKQRNVKFTVATTGDQVSTNNTATASVPAKG